MVAWSKHILTARTKKIRNLHDFSQSHMNLHLTHQLKQRAHETAQERSSAVEATYKSADFGRTHKAIPSNSHK
jgi:hypothetical protein